MLIARNNLTELSFSEKNFHLLQSELQQVLEVLDQANKKIAWFEEQFKLSRDRQFGRSSEKLPSQQILFDAMECDEIKTVEEKETITYTRSKPKKSCGRKLDTSKLPRERVLHDVEEKICGCGKALVKIGEDPSEQVELIPAVLKVIEHVTPKYACHTCKKIVQGKKPETVVPKAMAGNSLIADVVVKKYQYHLPLYRQSKLFKQEGLDIPDNTLGHWIMQAGIPLEPLEEALWHQLTKTHVLQADETPVVVLTNESKGYLWVYHGCEPGNRYVMFEYANSRSSQVVNQRLAHYEGILQTDGYSGYNQLSKQEKVIRVGCFAHCRRKYMAIVKTTKTPGKAHEAVRMIDQLYQIETEIRGQPAMERKAARQTRAKPILDKFKTWVDQTILGVPTESALGHALAYTVNQWRYLYEYVNQGEVEIDNNWVENQIRPFALGRRNWLFLGNEKSAAISARYYSLIQTCILNDINPRQYLNYIFTQVHRLRRKEIEAESLLPQFIDKTLLV